MKGESVVDQAQRDEACEELRAAIESTRLKVKKQEGEMEGEEGREQVGELKGLIADMEERVRFPLFPSPTHRHQHQSTHIPTPPTPLKPNKLTPPKLKDLKGPPIDLNETLFGKSGLLGAGGPSSSIQDAKKNATDLSSLVRKKARDEGAGGNENGKRKAEEGEGGGGESPKKAKVEDA